MAPFARRRAPIYVSAALWCRLTLLKKAFVCKLVTSAWPGAAQVLLGRPERPSDATSASTALLCAARMANPSACIDKREPARLPARGASKQASIAYASPRELLGESDRSVAGLRDFAKTPGPRALRRLRRLRRRRLRTPGRLQYAIAACLGGAERAGPQAARDVRSPTRDS